MTPQAPCKGCKERTTEPNCHITCEKYNKFTKELAEVREKDYQYRQMLYHNRKHTLQ